MSYENLLTDRCEIYHLQERESDNNFGIPSDDMQKEYYYPDEANHTDVKSYFTEKTQTVSQAEPNQVITETYNVHFLKTTDIRMNDKVVWGGIAYKARKPRIIKNHHIEVTVFRSENV